MKKEINVLNTKSLGWVRRWLEWFTNEDTIMLFFIAVCAIAVTLAMLVSFPALSDGGVRLPGEDVSAKMDSAGTLLRFLDTGIFKWTARILAGLSILGAGWSLKEMRFGPAVIGIIAAILFGTAPTWVRNIFSIGGADSVFSQVEGNEKVRLATTVNNSKKAIHHV